MTLIDYAVTNAFLNEQFEYYYGRGLHEQADLNVEVLCQLLTIEEGDDYVYEG